MTPLSLGATQLDDVLRVVRALGSHRYVAGRLHLVHAFAAEAIPSGGAREWALSVIADHAVDKASRDERLWRRSTEADVAAVLEAFWTPGPRDACNALRARLAQFDLAQPDQSEPFDESQEDEMHPLLVDAGWELLPLAKLDPQRHAGAIGAFGEPIAFESARFEEETAIPPPSHLIELPAIGAAELLHGCDDGGALAEAMVAWCEGNATYVDYVIRGVRRAARLPER